MTLPHDAFGQPIGEPLPTWTNRPAPSRTVATGRLCRLEPLSAAHADSLFEAFAQAPDARDWTYVPNERPGDLASYRAIVVEQARSDDPLHHAVVEVATGRALGTAAFMRMDPANGVIEIGHIVFSPAIQKTAAGSEAIFLLMRRAFDELGYRRLEWKCDRLNARSCRAAERYGFAFEGVFRQAVVTKGRNRDTAWYAMTDRDWPAARAAFELWLAPANFDADGRQRQGLQALRRGSNRTGPMVAR